MVRLKELKLDFGGTEPERERDGQTDVEVEIVIYIVDKVIKQNCEIHKMDKYVA